jgi:hypothetical protein
MGCVTTVVGTFLDAGAAATHLLGRPEVAARWEQPSVLAEYTVAGLSGHLLRAMTTVEQYLEEPEPDGTPIPAHEYFRTLAPSSDVHHPANQAIRARGAEMATGGPEAVADRARAVHERLTRRLAELDTDRRVRVAGSLVVTLEEYLRTRIVELVVHGDDLAASVDLEVPPPDRALSGIAIETLVEVARGRHGDLAVLRALARRERDHVDALHVM